MGCVMLATPGRKDWCEHFRELFVSFWDIIVGGRMRPRAGIKKKLCAGLMKSIIWRTHDRQTILITVTFATKPRGLYPKTAKIEKRDNKEIEENEKANKRRPNN